MILDSDMRSLPSTLAIQTTNANVIARYDSFMLVQNADVLNEKMFGAAMKNVDTNHKRARDNGWPNVQQL